MAIIKKYMIPLIIYLPIIIILVFLIYNNDIPFKKEPIYIAVAGPMTGSYSATGKAMVRGVRLYIDKINDEGGIDGKKIELIIFDDKEQVKSAMNVASAIAENKEILLVIGHEYIDTSIAAGRIYRKNGIPAITASTTGNRLTLENEWYFRIIPNNKFQGNFICNYIFRALNRKSASIVFDTSEYGKDLADSFEYTARRLSEFRIKKRWSFDSEAKDADKQLRKIISELRTVEDPGVIFLAMYEPEGAKIISALKFGDAKYDFIGPDTFSGDIFLKEFEKYPQKKGIPGYYTDNIYAISPFLSEIANEKAYQFKEEFIRKYDEAPSWVAAGYYDAALIAVEAMKRMDAMGKGHIRKDRREIRQALTNFYSLDDAVKGVTGYLYFDKNRDVTRPLFVGIYKKNQIFPAFFQYQMIPESKDPIDGLKDVIEGDILQIEGSSMCKTDIVYTGIDINEISNLDIKRATYSIDFYIWFRYQGEPDAANIRFFNATQPIKLETPTFTKKTDDYTVETYHLKAAFKGDFDFHIYPFDTQLLSVKFHHAEKTREKLIYVADTLGMPSDMEKKQKIGTVLLNASSGWHVKEKFSYQDILTTASTLGDPESFDSQKVINYSRFNAMTSIRRSSTDAVLRNFLPLGAMLFCLYIVYFISYEQYQLRILIVTVILSANTFYHNKLLSDLHLEYCTILEYASLTIYALILVATSISTLMIYLHRRDAHEKLKLITRIGKIVHPCIFIIAVSWIILIYFYRL